MDTSENSNVLAYYYIGLSFAFILLMMFMGLCSCYWQSRQQSRGNSSNSNRTVIFMERDTSVNIEVRDEEQDAILNSYPILLYSQVKIHKPDYDSTSLICSICLGDYKDSEWLRFLPDCGHFFHKECIATWFRLNLSCPLCRSSPFPTPLAEVSLLPTTHERVVEALYI